MRSLTAAESLLRELGISDPSEIDLDAVAWHVGARIKYRELDGCEARILGVEQRAIISVDQRQNRRRQRFSVGHELGHWKYHRSRDLICRSEDIGNPRLAKSSSEYVANEYAANLLMPWYLILPVIRGYSKLNVELIDEVSELFDVSRSATAIRVIHSNEFPAILVCHNQNGRRWFKRSRCVPDRWFPQNNLDSDSYAFDLVFGAVSEKDSPSIMPADAWFDKYEARKYEIQEQSFRTGNREVLTLLTVTDERMLDE